MLIEPPPKSKADNKPENNLNKTPKETDNDENLNLADATRQRSFKETQFAEDSSVSLSSALDDEAGGFNEVLNQREKRGNHQALAPMIAPARGIFFPPSRGTRVTRGYGRQCFNVRIVS